MVLKQLLYMTSKILIVALFTFSQEECWIWEINYLFM